METTQTAQEISSVLRNIETQLKKSPPFKFGPRTIDLDILLYGTAVIREESLTIPHPRMHERRFVLEPLCELIEEDSLHPVLEQSWHTLLQEVMDQQCKRMEEKAR